MFELAVVFMGLLGLKSPFTVVTMVKMCRTTFPPSNSSLPANYSESVTCTAQVVKMQLWLRKVLPSWAGPYLEPWELTRQQSGRKVTGAKLIHPLVTAKHDVLVEATLLLLDRCLPCELLAPITPKLDEGVGVALGCVPGQHVLGIILHATRFAVKVGPSWGCFPSHCAGAVTTMTLCTSMCFLNPLLYLKLFWQILQVKSASSLALLLFTLPLAREGICLTRFCLLLNSFWQIVQANIMSLCIWSTCTFSFILLLNVLSSSHW